MSFQAFAQIARLSGFSWNHELRIPHTDAPPDIAHVSSEARVGSPSTHPFARCPRSAAAAVHAALPCAWPTIQRFPAAHERTGGFTCWSNGVPLRFRLCVAI